MSLDWLCGVGYDILQEHLSSDFERNAANALDEIVLDEIVNVQTFMEQCSKALNRLETLYKRLGR